MKKLLVIITLMVGWITLNAQDIIVLRDATEIEAKILEITDTQIFYKRFDNPDGPIYKKNNSDVFYIKYANGTKDVFTAIHSVSSNSSPTTTPTKNNEKKGIRQKATDTITERPFIRKPMFEGYVEGCLQFGKYFGIGLNIGFGSRLFDYLYAGIQVSAIPFMEYDASNVTIALPFQFDLRVFLPTKKKVYPFLDLAFGPGLSFGQGVWYSPCFQVGPGFDVGRFTMSIGYSYFYRGYYPHYGYLKMGVRFGKRNK